jgi:sugar/nucleoside kinase (ribokinase family)
MSRLGLRVAALSLIGSDHWGTLIRDKLAGENVDIQNLVVDPQSATSVTAVLVDRNGERTFAFHAGASQLINRKMILDRLDLFANSNVALFGYYHLLPQLEDDLPHVLAEIRKTGCRTALDTANGGGALQPLDRILQHLDFYIPNYAEAKQQTGQTDPREMISVYRECGTTALLGIKLGDQGALLSPTRDSFLTVAAIAPPGPVIDTTGAGDCFYAGLIRGLIRGMTLEQAANLAAAAGAWCVTGTGATDQIPSFEILSEALHRLASG